MLEEDESRERAASQNRAHLRSTSDSDDGLYSQYFLVFEQSWVPGQGDSMGYAICIPQYLKWGEGCRVD